VLALGPAPEEDAVAEATTELMMPQGSSLRTASSQLQTVVPEENELVPHCPVGTFWPVWMQKEEVVQHPITQEKVIKEDVKGRQTGALVEVTTVQDRKAWGRLVAADDGGFHAMGFVRGSWIVVRTVQTGRGSVATKTFTGTESIGPFTAEELGTISALVSPFKGNTQKQEMYVRSWVTIRVHPGKRAVTVADVPGMMDKIVSLKDIAFESWY
jgi:hypothetical protein